MRAESGMYVGVANEVEGLPPTSILPSQRTRFSQEMLPSTLYVYMPSRTFFPSESVQFQDSSIGPGFWVAPLTASIDVSGMLAKPDAFTHSGQLCGRLM